MLPLVIDLPITIQSLPFLNACLGDNILFWSLGLEPSLIPGVIKHLIKGEIPILRTKGNFKREWVYVKDVVSAYIATADAVIKNKNKFIAYNFASGETKSVMEVYEIISTLVVGEIIKPKIQLDSEFEIKDQQLD